MTVSTKQRRIAEWAREHPERSFVSLAHHIDLDWLLEAWRRTRKDGAAGVDGQTAREYAERLEDNLADLLERFRSGRYQAPPVRRAHVPKGTGPERRPIGIPTLEDKVLQRAVAMVLEPIYERDFLDCSYGFRPERSAHQALDALWRGIQSMGGATVADVDVRKYFDTIDRSRLREFLARRVRDGVIRRMIDKWLKAGVWEDGRRWTPELGTPQGGVISPLLANIYLHEVLDAWWDREVLPRLEGRAFLIRFADDFVMVFARESDALRVMEVLPRRLAKYGLQMHSEKTRLVRFRPPVKPGKGQGGGGGSFDFLGFTHYWGRSRKGYWVVKRKTAKDRLRRSLGKLAEWCRKHRHWKVGDQHRRLVSKVRGHYQYFGVTNNGRSLKMFLREATKTWRRWLDRRTRPGTMPWPRFELLLKRYPLPPVRVYHSVYTAKP